jgi:hypothetical protein
MRERVGFMAISFVLCMTYIQTYKKPYPAQIYFSTSAPRVNLQKTGAGYCITGRKKAGIQPALVNIGG